MPGARNGGWTAFGEGEWWGAGLEKVESRVDADRGFFLARPGSAAESYCMVLLMGGGGLRKEGTTDGCSEVVPPWMRGAGRGRRLEKCTRAASCRTIFFNS